MKQRTLAMMTGFEQYTRKTRRAIFLEEMEQVVPWGELCALVEPHYPQPGNGRRPVGVERMLRIYFLQQWFNLSDPGVEEALYDSGGMRQFVGIDLGCEPAPDETTVCKFRHLLEEHQLGEQILGQVNLHLQAQGVRITTGTIVDATILHAPTSTKNREQQRDPEMHQTKKGKQWFFVLLSTPTCAFIPKYHCLPFFVWCISGSRCCSRFLVEVGACRMVASTIVPVVIRTPCACRCRFTCPRICSPSWCASSKCRNLHTVVSSGTGSQPRSMPTNCRIPTESYSASSTAGSDRLNHCCKK